VKQHAEAIDRLIARIAAAIAVKKRGFARILDAEENHLTDSGELIAALRRRVGAIGVE
jgi:hypothetical protein